MSSWLLGFGECLRGTVDRVGGKRIETVFFCVGPFPVFPQTSLLVLREDSEGVPVGVVIPVQDRSVVAAYLRALSATVALVLAFAAFSDVQAGVATTPLLGALAASGVGLLSVTLLGRLGTREKALRLAYERATGYPVDPAILPLTLGVRALLRENLDPVLGPGMRRAAGILEPQILPEPLLRLLSRSNDPAILAAALSYARLEIAEGDRSLRAGWKDLHEATVERLFTLDPSLLAAATSE